MLASRTNTMLSDPPAPTRWSRRRTSTDAIDRTPSPAAPCSGVAGGAFLSHQAAASARSACRAAVTPERTAPSMVAGSPVAVQSPARKRLRRRVSAARAERQRGGDLCEGPRASPSRCGRAALRAGRKSKGLGDIGPEQVGDLRRRSFRERTCGAHGDRGYVAARKKSTARCPRSRRGWRCRPASAPAGQGGSER